jgi:hypothetical protein
MQARKNRWVKACRGMTLLVAGIVGFPLLSLVAPQASAGFVECLTGEGDCPTTDPDIAWIGECINEVLQPQQAMLPEEEEHLPCEGDKSHTCHPEPHKVGIYGNDISVWRGECVTPCPGWKGHFYVHGQINKGGMIAIGSGCWWGIRNDCFADATDAHGPNYSECSSSKKLPTPLPFHICSAWSFNVAWETEFNYCTHTG